MTVSLITIGDGRDGLHERAWASAKDNLPTAMFDQRIIVDDRDHQLGFAGAIREAWEQVECDHVFHLEMDFTFNEPVELHAMIGLLETHPELVQVSLKRQPWTADEKAAGGIVELHSEDFHGHADGAIAWTEHRRYFTTNPSVYPARVCRLGWPQESESEGKFTHKLLQDPLLRFAIWGRKFSAPKVTHIGDHRAGSGY